MIVALALACVPIYAAHARDAGCKVWRAFFASVKKGEKRTLEFRTHWGGDFNDVPPSPDVFVFGAKRCEHYDYAPASAVCDYLIENAPIEFSDISLKQVVQCLSKKADLEGVSIGEATLNMDYGNENEGALIDIDFVEDKVLGGMLLKVTADGY